VRLTFRYTHLPLTHATHTFSFFAAGERRDETSECALLLRRLLPPVSNLSRDVNKKLTFVLPNLGAICPLAETIFGDLN